MSLLDPLIAQWKERALDEHGCYAFASTQIYEQCAQELADVLAHGRPQVDAAAFVAEVVVGDCPRQHPHDGPCHTRIGPFLISWIEAEVGAEGRPQDAPTTETTKDCEVR